MCLSLLEEVSRKVRPPRTLVVPFGWGQPLGPPGEPATHRRVALEALAMLEEAGEAPLLRRL